MNHNLLLVLLLATASITSCQLDIDPGTPGCIQHEIKEFSKSSLSCNTRANVSKYSFQNMMVYVFDPGTCGNDMVTNVYDAACKKLGFLGGIAGNTKINGEDFSNAELISVVWEN